MTQDDYTFYTGQTAGFSDEEWSKLVAYAKMRLASFLCLETFPELTDENMELAELLAVFICYWLKYRGETEDIESKNVLHFTIKFRKGAANAFAQLYKNYSREIEKYSDCGSGLVVEKNPRGCCYERRIV